MSVINQDDIMILIQGAGIAGLTLAALLEKADNAYCIVEQATELAPMGAGLVLQPNARAVLASLGLEARVIESGCWLDSMSLGRFVTHDAWPLPKRKRPSACIGPPYTRLCCRKFLPNAFGWGFPWRAGGAVKRASAFN